MEYIPVIAVLFALLTMVMLLALLVQAVEKRDCEFDRVFARFTQEAHAECVSLLPFPAMSRDYSDLYWALCHQQQVLALVDYATHSGEPMRDPCLIKRRGPFEIVIVARGICYGEVSPFQRNDDDEPVLLAALCHSLNVEWVDVSLRGTLSGVAGADRGEKKGGK